MNDFIAVRQAIQDFNLGSLPQDGGTNKRLRAILKRVYASLGNKRIQTIREKGRGGKLLISRPNLADALMEEKTAKLTFEEARKEFGLSWDRINRALRTGKIKKHIRPVVGIDGRVRSRACFDPRELRALGPVKGSTLREAKSFLHEVLADGPVRFRVLRAKALNRGISMGMLRRAAKAENIRFTQKGFQGHGFWNHPSEPPHPPQTSKPKTDKAIWFLKAQLEGKEIRGMELIDLATRSGINYGTLYLAARTIGVTITRKGNRKGHTSFWSLPALGLLPSTSGTTKESPTPSKEKRRPGRPKGATDREAEKRNQRIRELMESGEFKSQASLARHMKVSEATVSRAIG